MYVLRVDYKTRRGVYGSGFVAAWKLQSSATNPEVQGYVFAGYADPIMGARLIEEAIVDDGFVWLIGMIGAIHPDNLKTTDLTLVKGTDIEFGSVQLVVR
jgi:hypothetical protein